MATLNLSKDLCWYVRLGLHAEHQYCIQRFYYTYYSVVLPDLYYTMVLKLSQLKLYCFIVETIMSVDLLTLTSFHLS